MVRHYINVNQNVTTINVLVKYDVTTFSKKMMIRHLGLKVLKNYVYNLS